MPFLMYFWNFKNVKNISKWKFFAKITNMIDVNGHSEHLPPVSEEFEKKNFLTFFRGSKKVKKIFFQIHPKTWEHV